LAHVLNAQSVPSNPFGGMPPTSSRSPHSQDGSSDRHPCARSSRQTSGAALYTGFQFGCPSWHAYPCGVAGLRPLMLEIAFGLLVFGCEAPGSRRGHQGTGAAWSKSCMLCKDSRYSSKDMCRNVKPNTIQSQFVFRACLG
jgi:hypothetical protein